MSEQIKNKFHATCLGAAVGEAIGMPAEGMTPKQVSQSLGRIAGFTARSESEDLSPIDAGRSARQTEAMLSVLASAKPLPDLQDFAFTIKQALNKYPEKWPKSTTFAWPPFPDGGHYTFSFAIPAARLLNQGRVTPDEILAWMHTLTPSSVVWQQSIWLYMRLLNYLYDQEPASFNPDAFLEQATRFIREAEGHFPGDFKIRRRMQVTEPMMNESLEAIAQSCGNVSKLAEDMITFTGAVFYRHHDDYEKALTEAANQGGESEASCFYLGSLFGALGGFDAIPKAWIDGYTERERVTSILNKFEENINAGIS